MAQTPHQNVNFSSIPKTHSDIKIWYCCFCFNYNQDTKASRLPYFFLRCTGHRIHPNSWLRRTHFFPLNVVRRTGPIHPASLWKSSARCSFCRAAGTARLPKEKHQGLPLELQGPCSNTSPCTATAFPGYMCIPAGIPALWLSDWAPREEQVSKENSRAGDGFLCMRPLVSESGLILCSTLLSGFSFACTEVVTPACLRKLRQ